MARAVKTLSVHDYADGLLAALGTLARQIDVLPDATLADLTVSGDRIHRTVQARVDAPAEQLRALLGVQQNVTGRGEVQLDARYQMTRPGLTLEVVLRAEAKAQAWCVTVDLSVCSCVSEDEDRVFLTGETCYPDAYESYTSGPSDSVRLDGRYRRLAQGMYVLTCDREKAEAWCQKVREASPGADVAITGEYDADVEACEPHFILAQ